MRTTVLSAALIFSAAAAGAQNQEFAESLGAGFLAVSAKTQALKADAVGATPAQALERVRRALSGSGVPDSYVEKAFAESVLYPDIPGRFIAPVSPNLEPPYDQYRRLLLTEERIANGARAWSEHAELMDRISARYHVDAGLLIALIGIETSYGVNVGRYRVFDALNTIMQKVPRRSDWAVREEAAFLRLMYADGLDPRSTVGSYAGAFGLVQFEPSSVRPYGVDFDGDGAIRLDQWPDGAASAANYLARNGYRAGDPFTADSTIGRSLHAYNHSDNYVRVILELREKIIERRNVPSAGTGGP